MHQNNSTIGIDRGRTDSPASASYVAVACRRLSQTRNRLSGNEKVRGKKGEEKRENSKSANANANKAQRTGESATPQKARSSGGSKAQKTSKGKQDADLTNSKGELRLFCGCKFGILGPSFEVRAMPSN